MSQIHRHVKVDGQVIPDPVRVLRVRQALGQPMWLEAQFTAGAPPRDPKKHFAGMLGKPVTLALDDRGEKATLDGLVAQASVETTGYSLVGRGPLYGLMIAPRSYGFVKQSPVQVLESVLKGAGVDHTVKATTPLATNPLPYIAQYGETDFDFVHRLAAWVGLVVYEHQGKVLVSQAPEGPLVRLKSTDITSARLVLEPAAVAARAVAMDYAPHDVVTQSVATIGASSDSGYRSALDAPAKTLFAGAPALSADAHPKTANGLTDQLRARARQLVARSIRYEFTTYHPKVQVGVVLEVSGHELFSEKLFVVSIAIDEKSHPGASDEADPFGTKVVAVPVKMVGPVEPPAPRQAGMVSAMVSETKDPEKLGRVLLKFVWDDQATAWARVASYSAGANHGAFWVPEVGDEVLVGFEFGDPSRPIIVGSLYHDKSAPKFEIEGGTEEVLLARTKAGTEIRVVQAGNGAGEAGKSERIRLRVGESGPEISIIAGDAATVDITVEGGTCNLKAKEIALTADEEVHIKGGKISLESQGEITIIASSTVQVKGSQISLN